MNTIYFNVSFKRQFNTENREGVAKNVAKNYNPQERKEIIIDKIKSNIKFTKRSLASELNVDNKTIERDLEVLKKEKKIIFIGSKRSGKWKLVE